MADCILSNSCKAVSVKGVYSVPKRKEGLAMLTHVDIPTSTTSGPSLATKPQTPLYFLAPCSALFWTALVPWHGDSCDSIPRYLNSNALSRQPVTSSPSSSHTSHRSVVTDSTLLLLSEMLRLSAEKCRSTMPNSWRSASAECPTKTTSS